jgi:hypothetical protein
MTKKVFLNSKLFIIMVSLLGITILVLIAQKGYQFGQWLYAIRH